MASIYSYSSTCCKITRTFIIVGSLCALAISLIGLCASETGAFGSIVQWGMTNHGIILGVSLALLILQSFDERRQAKKAKTTKQETTKLSAPAVEPEWIPNRLPPPITALVLSYLNEKTLEEFSQLKNWQEIMTQSFIYDSIWQQIKFDKRDWQTIFAIDNPSLPATDTKKLVLNLRAPQDTKKLVLIKRQLLASLTIEEDRGFTILTIPKGLSIGKLREIFKHSQIKDWRSIPDFSQWLLNNKMELKIGWEDQVSELYENIEVPKTYRILISNALVVNSRVDASEQRALLAKHGCRMPKVIEVYCLMMIHFFHWKKLFLVDKKNSGHFTRCEECLENRAVLFGNNPSQFIVHFNNLSSICGLAGTLAVREIN